MAKEYNSVEFCRKTEAFLGVDVELLNRLKHTYQALDVEMEIKRMALWLISARGKRRKGNLTFIMRWLDTQSGRAYHPPTTPQKDSPLSEVLDLYLEGLWTHREHLFRFNSR